MSKLFSPLKIKQVTLKNRLVVSPMCQYSSKDGFANNWHLVHLGSRAVGGAGLVLFEATAVVPEGRITPHDLGLWKDEQVPALKQIVTFIEENNAVAGIQLAHAGRKASTQRPWEGGKVIPAEAGGWQTVAPSALPFQEGDPVPHELQINEIKQLVEAFKEAARRSLEAGFKVIEIHGAHGYLIHEFLSPISNKRTDSYGGSFQNRIRFLLEIVQAVQQVWPQEFPLFVRLSTTDWVEGGWTIDDSVALASVLKEHGVDLIDCSSGANVPRAQIPVGPGYQVPFAEKIKQETGILTGAVGMITTATQAEEIVASGKADLVLMARELLRNPHFPLHAAHELGAEITWPSQYERAKPRIRK